MTPRRAALIEKLRNLQTDVRSAQDEPGASGYLPGIEATLERMLEKISAPRAERDRIAGGLGRVVTDDYAFSESELGGRLLAVADEYAEL